MSIVDLTTIKNKEVRNRDLLLQEGFLFTLGLTSATGLPVELCNDDDFKSGKCGRGEEIWIVFCFCFCFCLCFCFCFCFCFVWGVLNYFPFIIIFFINFFFIWSL